MSEKSKFIWDYEDLKGMLIKPANGIEEHPYKPFTFSHASILILGSFPGLEQTRRANKDDEWFYSAKDNLFWPILESVYSEQLQTITAKQELFKKLGIAITDVILKAKRRKESNSDSDLEIVEDNRDAIQNIIWIDGAEKIKKVLFTSKFVQKKFLKMFPDYSGGECLPSPSQAANIYIVGTEDYKKHLKENPNGNLMSYRVHKYKELLNP